MPDTPIEAGHIEWIQYRYRDLTDDDLFWFLKTNSRENKAFRKVNRTTALDLSKNREFVVNPNQMVYQKEY